MNMPLRSARILTSPIATRLGMLCQRPWCDRCEGVAWWRLDTGEHVCSSCLCREEERRER